MTTLAGAGGDASDAGRTPGEPAGRSAVGDSDVLQFLNAFREGAAPAAGGAEAEAAADVEGGDVGGGDVLQFLNTFRETAPVAAAPRAASPASPTASAPSIVAPPAPVEVAPVPRGAAGGPAPAGPSWAPPAAPVGPGQSWAPPAPAARMDTGPAGDSTRPRRGRMWERIVMGAVLVVTAAALILVDVHNQDAANKWRRLDQAQVRISAAASQQISTANANIAQLNSEVRSLDGQVSSIQGQLSNVANQKEKAIDQTTVFKDLLAAAGQVANHLQDCIASTNQLDADVTSAVASGDVAALGPLQAEASAVASTCAQAQAGNNALQAAIQSAS